MDQQINQYSNQNPHSRIIISLIVSITATALIVGGGFYWWAKQKQAELDNQIVGLKTQIEQLKQIPSSPSVNPTPSSGVPSLSNDRKSIVLGDSILLVIDDDEIFNFFKTKSQLCDGYNLTSIPNRKMFCEDKTTFKNKTRFASIVLSPDKTKIGFSIETDEMSPDKVVGIFYPSRTTDKIHFLTSFYLGNEFISFSPSGVNFVYKGDCWEALCGLVIKNSETLADKASLNNPEFVDYRSENAEFVRWITDSKVEYKIGKELKQVTF